MLLLMKYQLTEALPKRDKGEQRPIAAIAGNSVQYSFNTKIQSSKLGRGCGLISDSAHYQNILLAANTLFIEIQSPKFGQGSGRILSW